ncbi:uncharacterized protein LOC122873589 [Siniperca chuatsi]|uniref:uncharacterized protein LOC122873589 n=1 Tax=Siniperca chuatsi TaxID=119488 RepID=UPI001CE2230C|nr:uncharacterized protein LOC122873589 [Siniperca chuatsi]XP_044046432.1 uncharacterized protein LOC122873589 [Siniperca chuatsi]
MGSTALHILLWLLSAFTLTTQELARLSVSSEITAECGKQVTLNCDVSSSRNGLSVIRMEWSQNKTTLCSVDSEGNITTHPRHTLSDFHCEYKHGQLSLIFQKAQPLGSGNSKRYMCKLQSNQGALHGYTRVELQECCGSIKGILSHDGPACTFKHVYPDGDVHWFHGSHNLSDGHYTTKSVDKDGWLTIHSHLKRKSSDVSYSCFLKSTTSGRYIASTLVQKPEFLVRGTGAQGSTDPDRNGVGSQRPMRTFVCISILLAVTLK